MKNQNRHPIIYFAVFFLTLCGMTLKAQITWDGSTNNDWATASNWVGGMVPGATDDVIIPAGSMVVIDGATSAVARKVSLSDATLIIEAGGSLSIDGTGSIGDAFIINNNSVVTNSGTITVTMAFSEGIFLDNASTFTNNGTVSVDNSSSDGLQLDGSTPGSSFINNGILNLTNDGSEAIKMENNAFFRNSVTGIINIENDGEEAIYLDDPGAEFINEGNIFINSAGYQGIHMDGVTSFTNTRTGYIQIVNVGLRSKRAVIEIDGGTLINDGTIEIDGGDDAAEGIDLDSGSGMPGIFINNGFITIENVQDEAIDILGSGTLFTNNLLINIGLSSTSVGHAIIRLNATLNNNSECGIINMTTEDSISVRSSGTLTNEGVITTVYSGLHNNSGTFTNNGEIATPDGNFNLSMGSNPLVGTGTVTMGAIPRQPSNECLGITEIPTLGEWSLSILALLMVIFGLVWMKSRQVARSF